MAGFRKAKAEQAALKMGIYGPAGSGKTFTALLVAEGLANASAKRIAFVDTERGTDFYVQPVADRKVHPEAFDIDAIYTRSITEVLKAVREIKPQDYSVIVIDSITHLWEAAIAAYSGKRTSVGTIPMQAWSSIKKPYKELMHILINSPYHVLILGRQANQWEENEETGELAQSGYKMRAEGETPYEPHVLIRIESVRPKAGKKVIKHGVAVPTAFVEKDRSGILSGQLIEWPSFGNIAAPLLKLLGDTQARMESEEETAMADADALKKQEQDKVRESADLLRQLKAKVDLAKDKAELEAVGKEITPAVKAKMLPADLAALREYYLEASHGRPQAGQSGNGKLPD